MSSLKPDFSSLKPDTPPKPPLDIAAARAALAASAGQEYWRSLEELSARPEFQEMLAREFPRQAVAWNPALDRRSFLTLLGASLALAGLSGCAARQPDEAIVPFVDPSEAIVPGLPLQFATAMTRGGYADGLLGVSREGRPIKIEGNPDHPASLGATDAPMQASLLEMYDPNRSQAVLRNGIPDTWDRFLGAVTEASAAWKANSGEGLRILTETVTSPTLAAQIAALRKQYPRAAWHQYEPVHRDAVRAAARSAFGADIETHYDFSRAEVILSLDADFLLTMPGHVRYARDFADRRRVLKNGGSLPSRPDTMNRLYAAECAPCITGAMADHRIAVRPALIRALARSLAVRIGVENAPASAPLDPALEAWVAAAARDLQSHSGSAVVVPGEWQPAEVHALAHAINARLGAVGTTVLYTDPVVAEPIDQTESLRALVSAMQAGQVGALLMLGGNPVYGAPADLEFTAALGKVPLSVHLSRYEDETSALCRWHIPEQHYLESWSDCRAYDGTTSIVQPLIAPLYSSAKSVHEFVDAVLAPPGRSGHDIVKEAWRTRFGAADFDAAWRRTLHDGIAAGSAAAPASPAPVGGGAGFAAGAEAPPGTLEVLFRPDPNVWDGRHANNGWLQELPRPLTKLTWDNAALMSPRTAEARRLANEEVVELRYRGRTVRAPVWIVPGHADDCVTLPLGFGRQRAGHVGTGVGFDAYSLRDSAHPWDDAGLEITRTSEVHRLACTHSHHTMEGRDLIRFGSIGTYRKKPDFVHGREHEEDRPPMILAESPREGYAWGMAIDNNVCIGCNACVAACQAENNIPVVGKEETLRGREMHWLRIDRYYNGRSLDAPRRTLFMPVPCMHCEKAPCELVCPVEATVHDKDGLNQMVYNRCVGTRYCSNNCPYKVRRFNFLEYSNLMPVIQLMRNPEVTVRTRGVMEKCTYCTQRIQAAKITAEEQNRTVRDGEVVTACQQSCPTRAIVFGDINDPQSLVSKLKAEPANYSLLPELSTRPRTTYLAKLDNSNVELEDDPDAR